MPASTQQLLLPFVTRITIIFSRAGGLFASQSLIGSQHTCWLPTSEALIQADYRTQVIHVWYLYNSVLHMKGLCLFQKICWPNMGKWNTLLVPLLCMCCYLQRFLRFLIKLPVVSCSKGKLIKLVRCIRGSPNPIPLRLPWFQLRAAMLHYSVF